jgi:hypothetical protein
MPRMRNLCWKPIWGILVRQRVRTTVSAVMEREVEMAKWWRSSRSRMLSSGSSPFSERSIGKALLGADQSPVSLTNPGLL